jgi:hypothetical protein
VITLGFMTHEECGERYDLHMNDLGSVNDEAQMVCPKDMTFRQRWDTRTGYAKFMLALYPALVLFELVVMGIQIQNNRPWLALLYLALAGMFTFQAWLTWKGRFGR